MIEYGSIARCRAVNGLKDHFVLEEDADEDAVEDDAAIVFSMTPASAFSVIAARSVR